MPSQPKKRTVVDVVCAKKTVELSSLRILLENGANENVVCIEIQCMRLNAIDCTTACMLAHQTGHFRVTIYTLVENCKIICCTAILSSFELYRNHNM